MSDLTEFQKRRLENIKRNNELLKKLNLSGAATQIKREAGVNEDDKVRKKKTPRKSSNKRTASSKPVRLPTRRSSRLRGEAAEGNGVPNLSDTELMKKQYSPDNELLDDIKETKIIGDVKLSDLIKSEHEDDLLNKFKLYADKKFSSGDFFQEIRKHKGEAKPELEQQQKEFDLQMYEVFQPNEIKITKDRISAMYIHPIVDKKLIIGGDTGGNLGFWNVRDEPLAENGADDLVEPDITRVQLFNKNVSTIDCFPSDSSKILTSSYDGFVRSIDLNNLKSRELLQLKNEYDESLGVSKCQFSHEDTNVLFLSTLDGEFSTLDLRAKSPGCSLRRLSDKKIGSFCINPNRPFEIATGSLDRTLRLWDVRKLVEKPEWSQYTDLPSYKLVSTYDSRLSVSAVSYSPTDNTLVCNGYDDTIRLFDVKNDHMPEVLEPNLTLKHNCQSGRWTSILKSIFKPNKNVFAIANMKRAIDIYNSDGEQLAHMQTATVPAVLAWHPLQNWIAGGNSSGKVFLFTDEKGTEYS
ncbi:hypothetical protein HG535_0E05000 [Zygotorulaspora mrakii]|uniref:DNA damage-binding protein CMR1 n=1 Tax=Zygotorulaspora mrakii TaxID=42260 RepID=A0A7H9B4W3_ZYGMR|nr:uncharacterized protein HG535_0E05000 [Zygotorulaspora mrakii]QLG73416.1 hypothetical protein HG535_0E05000 [Zygotorulaspora mrakii]